MKNLLNQVIARTESNIVTKKSKKNICDHLHEILFEKKQTLTRVEIIGIITLERLKDEFPDIEKTGLTEESEKRIKSINITVKNGLDTAVCNGSTSSSYCSNPKYKDYELIKDGNKLSIIKK